MVLGAGPFQAPGIRKAAEMGARVITVDNLPGNVGHQFGSSSVDCSTTDRESVLAVARAQHIDGICTFSSDIAVPTVAFVCEQLGLPGATTLAAETMATKHRFRAFLTSAAFPCPDFVSGSDFDKVFEATSRLKLPIMFKPVDTSGSRGVNRVDTRDRVVAERAFLLAQRFSRTGTVCVEEFVHGTEVGGDAIMINGQIEFIAITHKHLNGFVVMGHSLPANIANEDQHRVAAGLAAVCGALGYRNGPLNFDVIVAPEAVTILEMSARNGGNGIPAVIERATGYDVERATIAIALGESPNNELGARANRGAASFVFGSRIGGRLERICSAEELRRRVPEIFHVYYVKKPGDSVEPLEHNGNLIGFALFDCDHPDEYDRVTESISAALEITISSQ